MVVYKNMIDELNKTGKPASATAGDARSGIDAVGRGARESSELDTKKRKILKAKRVFGGLVGVETVQN